MGQSKDALQGADRRRLLAVLAADIVAYTQLMAENEDDTFYRLQDLNGAVIAPSAARNHGRIVKWTGNGFISIFESAVDAVRAAIEIQSGIAALGAGTDKDRRLRLRIGISAGDVITVPGDVFGDTVNVAARLQTLAAPGNICISRAVRDAVRGKFSIEFEERGDIDLKNIPDPVGTFKVVFDPIAWTMNQEIPPPEPRRGLSRYALAAGVLVAVVGAATVWLSPGKKPVEAAANPPAEAAETVASAAPEPRAPAPAAAPAPIAAAEPPPASVAPSLGEELTASLGLALPQLPGAERDKVVAGYKGAPGHKAQAASLQPPGLWRSAERPTAEDAESSALEDCQIFYNAPCVLLAVDASISPVPPGGRWPRHDMPRVHYSGVFDPSQIPGIPPDTRQRGDIVAYQPAPGPKAAAFHPHGGRIFTIMGGANQRAVEEAVLRTCNSDPERSGRDGPCFLYAVGNDVVLSRRLTEPVAAPGS